ncbi:hypothetical protein MKZ24_05575 [Paenibacillus sp. FSL R7-0297]|nr:hypothetical protein [Paenibacillus sp. FSL R5-0912]
MLFESLREKVTIEEEQRYHEVLAACLGQVIVELHEPPQVGV